MLTPTVYRTNLRLIQYTGSKEPSAQSGQYYIATVKLRKFGAVVGSG